MSKRVKIADNNYIKINIKTKEEIYYLVNEDKLKNIGEKNIFKDIFIFLASILWGGYFSTIITINSIKPTINSVLEIYKNVFFLLAIVFTLFALIFYIISYCEIFNIQKEKFSPDPQKSDQQKLESVKS